MRLRALSAVLLSAAALFTGGCASYIPFTAELQTEHHLVPKDLQNLQFYASHRITLRRELTKDSRQISGSHKLLVIAGKQIEEIVIEKHTPGVIVGVGNGTLLVSFEEGSQLEFALRGAVPTALDQPVVINKFAEGPDPFPGEHPRHGTDSTFLGAGDYFLVPSGGSTIEYQGQVYEAIDDTGLAHLEISSESLEEEQSSKKVLKGRQL